MEDILGLVVIAVIGGAFSLLSKRSPKKQVRQRDEVEGNTEEKMESIFAKIFDLDSMDQKYERERENVYDGFESEYQEAEEDLQPAYSEPVIEGRTSPTHSKGPVDQTYESEQISGIDAYGFGEKKREKIDKKKLIIYSEILKPKYQDEY